MTLGTLTVKQDDQVELKDGLIGRVITVNKGSNWNGSRLKDVMVMEVQTAFGIEEVTNDDVVGVV